jgi:23S rRNA (cytidine1920-2'-O)/16S rRNA (cytidine1409-2'-O)-methyltransferase
VSADPKHPYVSRGGIKLRHALQEFGVSVAGWRCADFGASVGGFTDCLLQAGAAHVTAVDTAYGQLAWTLRNDPRVTVVERTNAIHAVIPEENERVDLVVIDMGWTRQRLCVPAALKWLRRPGSEKIITLVKPHYEVEVEVGARLTRGGVLDEAEAQRVVERVLGEMAGLGARVMGSVKSPIMGSKGKARGNAEWLALLAPS